MDILVRTLLIFGGIFLIGGIVYLAVKNKTMETLSKILFILCAFFVLIGLLYLFL
ncbi:hypothetical protein H839_14029 [Parageobacillus genomosp. 1]|jgi:uncharacterized membrane protein|uniref:Uncharacterized protein n=1 Tax=Parageobacillus genomosp. 1 TaxID=1295642 RepID=A0ABC9VDU0_9BACL|nr:hypothetical protein [Parageobacillus genomosp. 1]EZP76401.1 hypothetical protein H839_14029 [Parageobacillus genomosp. 1]